MNISIITVGKIKEKYLKDAIEEYSKRLSKYCKFYIIEVPDEQTKENASEVELDLVKEKEAERILAKIPKDAYVFSLEIEGKQMDSVAFAKELSSITVKGKSHIAFVIGGSIGLHKSVSDRANEHLSFSKMTFPHQLMRVILLEQIYRAFRINNNEPYHK
ncbi:MAG: 23S rRNA (pseudouridine(1915)-N(3))-methyltransferase RlmH [Eubacterium sp.]|nr:23S rRNA (pseudouridine(1915)-N(3))-methyltransferase RlmH [Eubacterium sp.]